MRSETTAIAIIRTSRSTIGWLVTVRDSALMARLRRSVGRFGCVPSAEARERLVAGRGPTSPYNPRS
jgi:hypothetical protein